MSDLHAESAKNSGPPQMRQSMAEKMKRLTKNERQIAKRFGEAEALKTDGGVFVICGRTIGYAHEIERMETKGFIEVEQIGGSCFAKLSPAGRRALDEATHDR
jgi:hypothetical protein